jgi:putative DNA primase/helicase
VTPSTSGLSYLSDVSTAEAAAEYGRRGFRVLPLHHLVAPGVCSCARMGECGKSAAKHPRIAAWQREATSDLDAIGVWWLDWPHANVGLAMGGAARLVALDIDGPAGRASLAALEAQHGALPRTLTSRSGREDGGEHRLFHVPPALDLAAIKNRASRLAPGLDVRAEGGQIVVCPSIHLSGRPYTWIDEAPIAELPRWLFDLAAPPPAPIAPPPAPSPRTSGGADPIARAAAYLATMDPAISGSGGHQATWAAAVALVRGFDLAPSAALSLLEREFNPRCQPPWSRRELEHKVASAARAQLPRGYLLDDPRRQWTPDRAPRHQEAEHHGPPPEEVPPAPQAAPIDPKVAAILAQIGDAWTDAEGRVDEAFLARARGLTSEALKHLDGEQREEAERRAQGELDRLIASCAAGRAEAAPALARALDEAERALGLQDELRLPDPAEGALALLSEPPLGHVPTSLETLDTITDGGIHSGKFHVIAGEPNVGKTSLAVQLARCAVGDGWLVGFHVADVDDRSGIMLRIAQAHGLDRLAFQRRDPETLRQTAAILASWRPRFAIIDEAADGKTIDDTAAALLAIGHKVGSRPVLFVDSLQTIQLRWAKGEVPRTDKDRIDQVVKRLVFWTRKGLTVIATCEIPRGFYTGPKKVKGPRAAPPALAAFKGSGNIEYAAWTALVITRIRGEKDAVRVEVPKNKQGREDVTFRIERTESRVGYQDAGELFEHDDGGEAGETAPKRPSHDAQVADRVLDRVRAELKKHARGVAGGVEGLAALVGGKRPHARQAIRQLETAGEIERVGGRLFHRDAMPAETTAPPPMSAEQLRVRVVAWLASEAEGGRIVPSANAVAQGLREQGNEVRRAEVLDAIEVLVASGEIDRNGNRLALVAQ